MGVVGGARPGLILMWTNPYRSNVSVFGGGVGLIQLKGMVCHGNETSIMECRHQQPRLTDSTCSTHSRDVSVLCTGTVLLMATLQCCWHNVDGQITVLLA